MEIKLSLLCSVLHVSCDVNHINIDEHDIVLDKTVKNLGFIFDDCGIHDIHLRTLSVYRQICVFRKYHELPPTTHRKSCGFRTVILL